MCYISDTPFACDHPQCLGYELLLQTQTCGQAVCFERVRSFVQYMALTFRTLQEITQQETIISGLLDKLTHSAEPKDPTPQKQLPWECSTGSTKAKFYPILLASSDCLPNPLFRETGFHFSGYVTNKEGNILPSAKGLEVMISVYTWESPPRLLLTNISGKRMLRGSKTVSVDASGRFSFPNIVINEVSSHYLDDEFTLVISTKEDFVKPMVFRHVNVRARRKRTKSGGKSIPGTSPSDINNCPDS